MKVFTVKIQVSF